jgi:cell wall-associated NlpC family hydrolase
MKTRYSKILLSVALLLMVVLLISGQAFAQVTGRDIVNEAKKYEGNPVVMDSAEGVQFIYGKLGIRLPGTLGALSREGALISKGKALQLGDILFFGANSNNLIAAGIYLGNNQFIISHKPYNTIRVMSLSSSEPNRLYLGARRVLQAASTAPVSNIRERVIQAGLKYLGTPYEFGSDRSSTKTMDCSDFVRRTYYDATGKWIPGNSRTQADFVRQNGKVIRNMRDLKRGDLMFFTSPTTGKIFHVSIYMGNDRMLHATSKYGVIAQDISSYYKRNFYFGGNILD